MASDNVESVALIWAQFAAYHMDRCEAVARRLDQRQRVRAIEVATTSEAYAWEPSGPLAAAEKITLFPGRSFDEVPRFARFRAMLKATWRCRTVCIGVSYAEPDIIALAWLLRLCGKRLVVFSESKFDDMPRFIGRELLKAALLSCYHAAVVGGARHLAYFRFLGFRRRPVLPGYDTVGCERIAGEAASTQAVAPFEERPFVFVGRFVEKKNLFRLLEGYREYRSLAGTTARRLVLVGSGPLEPALRVHIEHLGIGDGVELPGFLQAAAVARQLAGALALVLVSVEEQWGLVINEALAMGLPVIASTPVGACDALVRNMVNGFVVPESSAESIGRAMHALAADPLEWERMAAASRARAWLADSERLADAVELLLYPGAEPARTRCAVMRKALEQ